MTSNVTPFTTEDPSLKALRRSLLPFEALVNSAIDGIITLDDEQRIILFNPSAEEIFGHKAAAIFTQPFNCLLPKRLRALPSQLPRKKIIAGEIGYPCRMRENFIGLRANGEEFRMEVSISEATIEEQSFFTLIVRDVTDRERTEETRARLAAIVESSHDAIIGKSLDGTITNWNKGAELLFGFTAGEIIGKSPSIFIPQDRLEEEMQLLARWQRDQTVTRYETVRLCKNGSLIDVSMSVSPIWGADGQIVGISKVACDITEQKRAQKELQRNEKHFRLLIENASDLITVVNAKGIIGFQSPSVKRTLGYAPHELLGHNFLELVGPDDRARVQFSLEDWYSKPASPNSIEHRFRRRDGTSIILQSAGRKLPDETDEGSVVINSRDVTEQKQLEAQLRHSQKMDAIGQCAGGVAHDFNNLLLVISGNSELLAMTMVPAPETLASLAAISHATKRAASLTRQLLAFSRQQVLEPTLLDLNVAVADAEKMFHRIIGEDVNLTTIRQHPISLVKVDPGQIDQVIMNLVVNARDAMPQGGDLTIEVSDVELDSEYVKSHSEARSGHHILLAISDTGCGMTPEVQARIFEPFFTTKDPGKGAGLGLAVAHGIIKQSGGHIGVLSELGVGTTFHIYLPVVDGLPEIASQSVFSKPIGGSETILLVEDDEPTRNITVLLLQHLGYRVLEAAGGKDAVRAAEASKENIQLLITDVVMPAMGGQELANALRSRAPTLKVLFQSGYTDPTVVRRGMLQPDIVFLQKPFTLNSLAKKVREILDRAG